MTRPDPQGSAVVSRRRFLVASAGVAGGVALAGCSGGSSSSPAKPVLDPVTSPVAASADARVRLSWRSAARARTYDVEVNGTVVASGLTQSSYVLAPGDGATGLAEGPNRWRVRAVNGSSTRWSDPGTFAVVPVGVVQVRRFDHEDDGDIDLTTRSATGTTLAVASTAAFGPGKGLVMRATDPADAVASKNHLQQPISQCWVRLAVRPQQWQRDGAVVHLMRIRSQEQTGATETLLWTTGRGLSVSSAPRAVVPMQRSAWTQVQVGVDADGGVELWSYDGRTEKLVARARNDTLTGAIKDAIALGNDRGSPGTTFEVHLDGFAVGEQRLAWANPLLPATLQRPKRLDPRALPTPFTFCFGSCNNAKSAPFRNTALGAAAATDPDFLIHLGDYGYPDSNAYRQSVNGYHALWSDLLVEDQLARLATKPWIYIASDHDMGRNDCDSTTCLPAASTAFAEWQNNDPAADGVGRYGSVTLDNGRVLLIWTEGIAFRSPLAMPDGPGKTVLGPKQKAWLLDLLRTTTARLVIIASQTSIGFVTGSDWSPYQTERAEVIRACQASPAAAVRFVSGDYHHAAWSRFGPKVAEWLAAPMAEFPEPAYVPDTLVDASATAAIGPGFDSRPHALAGETWAQFDAASSFGHVAIDGNAGTATFEVRDSTGNVRVDDHGFRFHEVVQYA